MEIVNNRAYFRHYIIELTVPFKEADSITWTKNNISLFIKGLGIETLESIEHIFKPQGISIVYIISSSHLSVHTWPENNYIHIDLLTCSRNIELENVKNTTKKVFSEYPSQINELKY